MRPVHAFSACVQCMRSVHAFRACNECMNSYHLNRRILIQYSEKLSHLIYAAADMVLVPSNFEPCGLT
eukprot:1161369-Pelagomonas_calceolata.AAC.3